MNKVVITEQEQHIMRANELAIGEAGVITDPDHAEFEHVILRAYDVFVDLTDPRGTWLQPEMMVRRLPQGTVLSITLGITTPVGWLNPEVNATQTEDILGRYDRGIVNSFLKRSEKINAIKHVRQVTNLGLKEAKDYVDKFSVTVF